MKNICLMGNEMICVLFKWKFEQCSLSIHQPLSLSQSIPSWLIEQNSLVCN